MRQNSLDRASLLLALGVLLALLPTLSLATEPVCLEGSSLPPPPRLANQLRPTTTARCPYRFDELVERIETFSAQKHSVDSVENVEKALGIPEMTAAEDESRSADYTMLVSGNGGWKLLLHVDESFYPTNSGSDRFVPGPRPRRLYNVRDADLSVNFQFLTQSSKAHDHACISTSVFRDALVKKGWKWVSTYAVDGAKPDEKLQFGDKSVVTASRQECSYFIYLEQTPPR